MENGPYSQVCVLGLNIKTILRTNGGGVGQMGGGRGHEPCGS